MINENLSVIFFIIKIWACGNHIYPEFHLSFINRNSEKKNGPYILLFQQKLNPVFKKEIGYYLSIV